MNYVILNWIKCEKYQKFDKNAKFRKKYPFGKGLTI